MSHERYVSNRGNTTGFAPENAQFSDNIPQPAEGRFVQPKPNTTNVGELMQEAQPTPTAVLGEIALVYTLAGAGFFGSQTAPVAPRSSKDFNLVVSSINIANEAVPQRRLPEK